MTVTVRLLLAGLVGFTVLEIGCDVLSVTVAGQLPYWLALVWGGGAMACLLGLMVGIELRRRGLGVADRDRDAATGRVLMQALARRDWRQLRWLLEHDAAGFAAAPSLLEALNEMEDLRADEPLDADGR